MTRAQFAHAVRAAGAGLGVSELLVIGSQAVHGTFDGDLPIEAARSVEVDLAVRGDVDGRLAEGAAGRQRDFEFCRALLQRGVVDQRVLRERLSAVSARDARVGAAVANRIPS